MSEPIRLWDASGVLWVTYSPSAARAAIAAGTHTTTQPAQEVDEAPRQASKPGKGKGAK